MQEEKYGERDMSYSAWHRQRSLARYVGIEKAQLLSMIDLDGCIYIEYDKENREPLALVETAIDIDQPVKISTVTRGLAVKAGLPAYKVLYRISQNENPSNPGVFDIDRFRVKRLTPYEEREWRVLTPMEWANQLEAIRNWETDKIDWRATQKSEPA